MNHNAAICPNAILPAAPLPRRWAHWLAAAWRSWLEHNRVNDELRALAALSDATLRDIGLAERVPPQPTLSALDYERGRW